MGTLKIETLGSSFTIQAEEDDEYLNKLLNHYKKVVSELELNNSVKNSLQIAILSGIMICDELYKEKSKKSQNNSDLTSDEAERLTISMIERIEKVLKQ